ncbi:dihydropteroate synthase [Kamptonema cortianum]|nr:dihydropteroate synthase [Geitlerinema splendidum]MDK3157684.1 dihydropteroate synthase [Kamptonema cortianum]
MKPLAHRPLVVGILNVTPDSFSDGGKYSSIRSAVDHALDMLRNGADLIDLGGESTRPGAEPVDVEEELNRVLPVASEFQEHQIPFSIDTTKPAVAKKCLELGAIAVNDVSGLGSAEMIRLCRDFNCSVVIMHSQGKPKTMQRNPVYKNVVEEVLRFLLARAQISIDSGIAKDKIWLDPGIGFGKTTAHNLQILEEISKLADTAFPIYLGVSRKRFIGVLAGSETDPAPPEDRIIGSVEVALEAARHGVKALRVHDVRETVMRLQSEYLWE